MFSGHDWRSLLVTKAKVVRQVVVLANKEANKTTQCPQALHRFTRVKPCAIHKQHYLFLCFGIHIARKLCQRKVHHLNTDCGHQKPVGFACLRTNETEPVEPFICRANRCRWSHAFFSPIHVDEPVINPNGFRLPPKLLPVFLGAHF